MQLANVNGDPNVLGNIKQLASNAKKMAKKYEYWKKRANVQNGIRYMYGSETP